MSEKSASRRSKKDALTPPYCEIPDCEYKLFFQRHRILPGRDGGKYKLGNVIALCPNHHAEADAGLIAADYLLEIVSRRIALSGITEHTDPSESTGEPKVRWYRFAKEPDKGSGERTSDADDGLGSRLALT